MSTVRDDFFIKMSEHVKILDAIFLDWERGGFLESLAHGDGGVRTRLRAV